MAFTDVFIKKPVLALTLSFAIILVGFLCATKLPVRQYPIINTAVITITTQYQGASPTVLEGFVSTPIEMAIAGIEGIDYISATNTQGKSTITVQLEIGYDPIKALTQINAAVSSVRWKLPKAIYNPVVEQSPTTSPVIYVSFLSKTLSTMAVSNYINRVILPQVESLPGVHDAQVFDNRPLSLRIWLDPNKMAANGITPLDISKALAAQNIQASAGQLRGNLQELNLIANTNLSTPEQFNNLVVGVKDGTLIRLKQVGTAVFGAENQLMSTISNGVEGPILAIVPQETANNITVADEILKLLPQLKAKAPPGLNILVNWDTSQFSKFAILTVLNTSWMAIVCVLIVILAFLGSLRTVFIPVITIPFSLIGACVFMYLLGYSINTLSLLGAVLAIGLVVDDAIVVLENIHRHMEEGMPAFEAALYGTREIALPVIAMTLTVAIVFIPIGLVGGLTGSLFHEFAFTVSSTVILSGIFALVLSPMMCSKLLKPITNEKSFPARIDRIMTSFTNKYIWLLEHVVSVRYAVLGVFVVILALCFMIFTHTHSELLPDENQGVVLGVGVAPTFANLDYGLKYGREMSVIFQNIPEAQSYGLAVGFPEYINQIISWIVMRPHQKGDRDENQIIADLGGKLSKIPGIMAFAMNRPPLAMVLGMNQPIQFVLKTTGDYESLNTIMHKLIDIADKYPGMSNVRTDLKIDKPNMTIKIDRAKAAAMGIPVAEITDSLSLLLAQPTISWFPYQGDSYPVIPQLLRKYRKNPEDLFQVNLKTMSGDLVPLSNLVSFENSVSPQSLNQFQQLHSATLQATVNSGYTIGQALNYLENAAKRVMPNNMHYDFSGQSRYFVQSQGKMVGIFVFALIAIYLMLAAKFGSFVDPFIIMLSVPLATTGALIAMHFVGANLNIYTQIGLVMLVGLISKHGILIVNYANHLQEDKGYSIHDAAIGGARVRFRPILMTTGAMVFGALPLVFATGAGHESLEQIGAVIIGGMLFGSCLTLFIVPTMYTFMATKLESKQPSTT